MAKDKPNLFLYGVPDVVGGAATKIRHLVLLLREVFAITIVVSTSNVLRSPVVRRFCERYGLCCLVRKDVPSRAEGIALAICELDFFSSGTAERVKKAGLKLIWSNEMMWEFEGEAEAVRGGLIDKVLFVSDFQAAKFEALYRGIPAAIPGNYVAPEEFAYRERQNPVFAIGRLSRPDPDKYPEDFPVFYEELGLKDVKYRVMAWDEQLRRKYRWHRFGPEWDLLGPHRENTEQFLQSLDIFVYPLGHLFKESWGRSTVEAMLTGCIPVVPAGHQFHNLIVHRESGFICQTWREYRDTVIELHDNYALRKRLARQCAEHARNRICNSDHHRQIWLEALSV